MGQPCALCGVDSAVEFDAVDRNRRLSSDRFRYFRCPSCGTLQLHPVPDDLALYYTAEYYAVPAVRDALVAASDAERYKLDIVRGLMPGGRLVEIGPAVGGFAALMQDAGYDVSAIEMDADCCRFLRDVVGVPTQQSSDPAAALSAEGPLDVIALWHVIEHLPDPRGLLTAAAQALRPGGILALAAPNPESSQFRLFGRRWTHLDAPRHLVLAPLATYARIGRELGLETALATDRDPGTLHWNEFGWRETLAGFATNRYVRHALRLSGAGLSTLMRRVDERAGRGSTYTLVMRKPLG